MQDALDARFIHAEDGGYAALTNNKDAVSSLHFIPLIRHESKTSQTSCKARAA
jgi:hypothetical protein